MFEWKELFIPKILKRGQELKFSSISNITIQKEGLFATIQGTNEYQLQIKRGFSEVSCSCPFAQENNLACKHIAALFFYCENHWTDEMEEFFEGAEYSLLGQQAKSCKAKRLMREAEKLLKEVREINNFLNAKREKVDISSQTRKRENKKQLRKKQQEKLEPVRQAKEEIKKEERLNKEIEERELRQKRDKERQKKLAFNIQDNEEREKNRKIIEAEEERQKKLDIQTAKKLRFLSQNAKKHLAEQEEYIRLLEMEEELFDDDIEEWQNNVNRLNNTGWYYSDNDLIEGTTYVDKYGNKIFIPDGYILYETKK